MSEIGPFYRHFTHRSNMLSARRGDTHFFGGPHFSLPRGATRKKDHSMSSFYPQVSFLNSSYYKYENVYKKSIPFWTNGEQLCAINIFLGWAYKVLKISYPAQIWKFESNFFNVISIYTYWRVYSFWLTRNKHSCFTNLDIFLTVFRKKNCELHYSHER